ncbi:MAG TPA: RNA polymerase factor sigma-54 [Myxococcota bacterium]|nr:RNA polymerase factor sigma-54 [Myxococcota bacterium]HOD06641.1 RNA polymerase factor sigma-54 [Myxococcota bacterium]HPB50469.1 RNA polymerase factor sigma-54 [Myxococcota bacterium]HQP95405.1 RNA polymerase factor sigma-54 [Myxococcota bacterium]
MDIRQELGTKLQQRLIPTPQLQIAIRLLQLSRLELVEEIRQQLDANPALEELEIPDTTVSLDAPTRELDETAEAAEARPEQTPAPRDPDDLHAANEADSMSRGDSMDWEKFIEGYSTFSHGPQVRVSNDEYPSVEATVGNRSSLTDHLNWQLQLSDMPDASRLVGEYIIGNINEDGYLVDVTDEEIADATGATVQHVREVLARVRNFDPPGVASRTLGECLLAQVELRFPDNHKLRQMIANHLPDLEKRNFAAIARGLKLGHDELRDLIAELQSLEPRPGRQYSSDDVIYIQPDVYVIKVGDDYMVVVNDDGLPRLKISQFYEKTLSRTTTGEARDFVKEKLRAATWLIKSINQRQSTIRRVTESIMKFQRDFLENGVEHLRPLVLREVADDVGMHESTVSRVTTNKYVHTPRGIFELKFFFNSRITAAWGIEDHSSMSVKTRIKTLIDGENTASPLSDQEIVQILGKEGVIIARRTVAKYREAMGIAPSSRRKELK